MNRKSYSFFLKKNRRKNPIAKALKFFTPQVIEDKKKYNLKRILKLRQKLLMENALYVKVLQFLSPFIEIFIDV